MFAFALEEQPTTDTIEELEIKFILQLSELARQRRLRDMQPKGSLADGTQVDVKSRVGTNANCVERWIRERLALASAITGPPRDVAMTMPQINVFARRRYLRRIRSIPRGYGRLLRRSRQRKAAWLRVDRVNHRPFT